MAITIITQSKKYLIGIDEVGRGPLAGPVSICAVCVASSSKQGLQLIKLFRDSKALSPKKRLALFTLVHEAKKNGILNYAFSSVSAKLIDRVGISQSVSLAIKRSLQKLDLPPLKCTVLLDGLLKAPLAYQFQKTIIKGDAKVRIISCASVIAKVKRDALMTRLHKKYPAYGFEGHKGYGTKYHIKKIKEFGPSEIHRQTFLRRIINIVN